MCNFGFSVTEYIHAASVSMLTETEQRERQNRERDRERENARESVQEKDS